MVSREKSLDWKKPYWLKHNVQTEYLSHTYQEYEPYQFINMFLLEFFDFFELPSTRDDAVLLRNNPSSLKIISP